MKDRLARIAAIIEGVDNRCMAADGPVTPTLREMTQEEISEIYDLATSEKSIPLPGAFLGSIDVTLCEHYPPGHSGGLHASHGERGLWYAAALLSACGVEGKTGQELRIVVESKEARSATPEIVYQCRIHGRVGRDNRFDSEGALQAAPDWKKAATRWAKEQGFAQDESFCNGWSGGVTVHVREGGTGREWLVDVEIEGNSPGHYHVESEENVHELTHYRVKPEAGGLETVYTDTGPCPAARRYAEDEAKKVFAGNAVTETRNILVFLADGFSIRVPVTRTHLGGDRYSYRAGTPETL